MLAGPLFWVPPETKRLARWQRSEVERAKEASQVTELPVYTYFLLCNVRLVDFGEVLVEGP